MALSSLSVVSNSMSNAVGIVAPLAINFSFPSSLSATVNANTFVYSSGPAYANGTYNMRAQCYYPNNPVYKIFDSNNSTNMFGGLNTGVNIMLDGVSTSTYNRNPYIQSVAPAPFQGGKTDGTATWSTSYDATSVTGEYWQVQFPFNFVLKNLYLIDGDYTYTRSPRDLYILGSNNGTTWTLVKKIVNSGVMNGTAGIERTYAVSSTLKFKYFRFVANNLIGGNGWDGAMCVWGSRLEGDIYA